MWKAQILQCGNLSQFNITGVKIGVHNWTHGINTPNGRFLSPENALKAISAKLADNADPNAPKGNLELVLIMLASHQNSDFLQNIEQAALILPDPVFKQAADYARNSAKLAETKMVKMPQIASPAFPKMGDITPESGRMLQAMNRASPAGGDPFAAIAMLKARKAAKQAENAQKAARLKAAKASVYAFVAKGELSTLADQLLQNIPKADSIFTACLCYIGQDLTNLKGLLHNE